MNRLTVRSYCRMPESSVSATPWRLFSVDQQDTRRERNLLKRLLSCSPVVVVVVVFYFVLVASGDLRNHTFILLLDRKIHSRIFVDRQTNMMFDNHEWIDGAWFSRGEKRTNICDLFFMLIIRWFNFAERDMGESCILCSMSSWCNDTIVATSLFLWRASVLKRWVIQMTKTTTMICIWNEINREVDESIRCFELFLFRNRFVSWIQPKNQFKCYGNRKIMRSSNHHRHGQDQKESRLVSSPCKYIYSFLYLISRSEKNVLFDNLTVEEHSLFFFRLGQMNNKGMKDMVEK